MKALKVLSFVSVLSLGSVLVGCGAETASPEGTSVSSVTASSADGKTAPTGPETHTRVLRDVTTPVVLTLNDKTAFCTDRGYGLVVLKISVPDLDWLAQFDHRVEGEGLPCMTAGQCTETLGPNTMIDANEPRVTTAVRVLLTETITLDRTNKTCERRIDEEVSANVRGQDFSHYRSDFVQPADFDTCADLAKL